MTLDQLRKTVMLVYHFNATWVFVQSIFCHPYHDDHRSRLRQYKDKFKRWPGFGKNTKKANGKMNMMAIMQPTTASTRTRLNRKIKEGPSLSESLFNRLSHRVIEISRVASPESCLLQETILKSIQDIAAGLFESLGWNTPDLFAITAEDQTTGLSKAWQSISDRTFGAARLAKMSQLGLGLQNLRVIFEDMESTMTSPDPSMLVKFWRICRYLHDLCVVAKDFTILKCFFWHYGSMTMAKQRSGSEPFPVVWICDALYQILQKDPDALMDSLRIGYLKSIHSLNLFISGDHATILAMWSNYLKHWDRDALHLERLKESYQTLLRESDRRFGKYSESSLSILDRFTYLAHYNLNEAELAKGLALDLVQRSRTRLQGGTGIYWCMETQYFAFGSKVLAVSCKEKGLHDEVQQWYSSAIAVLELGDSECQIRARMLRGELTEYLGRRNGVADISNGHAL